MSQNLLLRMSLFALLWLACLGPAAKALAALPVRIPVLDDPDMADEWITLHFPETEIQSVLKTIGDMTGINFVMDDKVRGTVTVLFPTQIRLGDLYPTLETILDVRGFAAVPSGEVVKVVVKSEAVQDNLPVSIGTNPDRIPQSDLLMTQIMTLRFARVSDVTPVLEAVRGPNAKLSSYLRTNSIVVTDTAARIHHLARIVQALDVEGAQEEMRAFLLQHASAERLSEDIVKLMQSTPTAPRGRNPAAEATSLKVLPDARTNALVVYAKKQDMTLIEDLVEQLDIPRPQGNDTIHVVYLKNAEANDVAQSLNESVATMRLTAGAELRTALQITADPGTNAIIVNGHRQDFELVAQVIEKLDIVREQILVELIIVEVTQNSLEELGVDWATMDPATGSVSGFVSTNLGVRVNRATLEGLSLGLWKTDGTTVSVGAILNALKTQSHANILSTPQITTTNHKKASIIVGENRAFVVQGRITESDPLTPTVIQNFEYRDVGIRLDITPHVSQGGVVRMEIDSEFTKLIDDVTNLSSNTPTTAKRQAQTVISMQSGSTVVIGGLMRDDKTRVSQRVPILGDLPLFGPLFRHDRDRIEKTNLLLFITPFVMNSKEQMDRVTEQKKQQMKEVVETLEAAQDEDR